MLVVAVAADDVGTMQRDGVPKRVGGDQKLRVIGEFIFAGDADDFGNLRVGVQAVQSVLAVFERADHFLMIEVLGQLQVIRVAGHAVKIGQHLGHAALLGFERPLHLRRRHVGPRETSPSSPCSSALPTPARCRSAGSRPADPAMILCSVYHGAQTGLPCSTRSMNDSGNADK